MRLSRIGGLGALLGLLMPIVAASAGDAPDLSKIERRIAKEPAYVCKAPLYGLYVFGPKATTRVWAVFDKSSADKQGYDVLYFDRNANGDLTESSKRIVGVNGSFAIGACLYWRSAGCCQYVCPSTTSNCAVSATSE